LNLSLAKSQVPWANDKTHLKSTKKITGSEKPRDNKLTTKYQSQDKEIPNAFSSSSSLTSRSHRFGRIPWNKGIPLSEETKRKMSQAHMGKPPTFKGRKHSLESRQRQSLSHRGKYPTEQTRLKISKSVKKYFAQRRMKEIEADCSIREEVFSEKICKFIIR
jgi:hypothetical protein